MGDRSKKTRWILVLVAAGALVGVGLATWHYLSPRKQEDPFPLPPFSDSRYLNVGPDAHAIGRDACARCHKDENEAYLLTAHSKALDEVNAANEPDDESFEHKPSGRLYRVYRQG